MALALTSASVDPFQVMTRLIPVATLLCFVVAVLKVEFTDASIEKVCVRGAYFVQGLVFLQISWIAIRLSNHLSMRMTGEIGYADGFLSNLDSWMSVDWVSYFEAIQSFPHIVAILDGSYTSLTFLSIAAFAVISCSGDLRRSSFFVEAFFFSAVICTFAGMFFPAQGSIVTHLGAAYDFSNFAKAPGMWFIEPLETIRSDKQVFLDIDNLPGLVSFPSFHTAAAVVLMVSFWRTMLFVPATLYGVIVIAATPIFGGHYFADLFSGAAVAVMVMSVLLTKRRFSGIFDARTIAIPDAVADQV